MYKFAVLVTVAGVAGGVAHFIYRMFWDVPFLVEGCVAGSVGYIAAWAFEMWRERPPTFKMDRWGR